jgi:hypothetical protein
MYYGLPTTLEELTLFKLDDRRGYFDLNKREIFEWICEYGPLFIDQFSFLCEIDMGHGAETHVIYFGDLKIYVGQGYHIGAKFLGIYDLPDAFANVKTEHVMI